MSDKEFLRANFVKGCDCPTCGQYVKLYRRKLNSGMAQTLILMEKHFMSNPVNVKSFLRENSLTNNHDWTLLKYWGLIEEQINKNSAKKSSGEWKVTKKGSMFANKEIRVQSHLLIYNNKFQGFSETTTDIEESLGNKFNYRELMSGF